MLSEMSATELGYWEDVYKAEFLGDERADYRAAQISAQIANWAGKTTADESKGIAPLDLMTFSKRAKTPEKETTQEEEEKKLDIAMAALMGLQSRQKPTKGKGAKKPK